MMTRFLSRYHEQLSLKGIWHLMCQLVSVLIDGVLHRNSI